MLPPGAGARTEIAAPDPDILGPDTGIGLHNRDTSE